MMSAVDRHFPFEPLRFFMTQSWARPTLAKYRPTATLLGLRTISGEVVGGVAASQDGTPVFPFFELQLSRGFRCHGSVWSGLHSAGSTNSALADRQIFLRGMGRCLVWWWRLHLLLDAICHVILT